MSRKLLNSNGVVRAWLATMPRSAQQDREPVTVSAKGGAVMFWRENKDEEYDRQAQSLRQSPEPSRSDDLREDDFTQHRSDLYDDTPGQSQGQTPVPPPQMGDRRAPATASESDTSVIAANTRWSGTLASAGPVRVQGEIEGEITSESDIFILEGATAEATLRAVNVTIAGSVEGEVTCTGRFEMLASGHLHGNVTAPTFVVHEGASVVGGLRMHDSTDISVTKTE